MYKNKYYDVLKQFEGSESSVREAIKHNKNIDKNIGLL